MIGEPAASGGIAIQLHPQSPQRGLWITNGAVPLLSMEVATILGVAIPLVERHRILSSIIEVRRVFDASAAVGQNCLHCLFYRAGISICDFQRP